MRRPCPLASKTETCLLSALAAVTSRLYPAARARVAASQCVAVCTDVSRVRAFTRQAGRTNGFVSVHLCSLPPIACHPQRPVNTRHHTYTCPICRMRIRASIIHGAVHVARVQQAHDTHIHKAQCAHKHKAHTQASSTWRGLQQADELLTGHNTHTYTNMSHT